MMPIKSHYICSQDEGYVGDIKEYYPTIKDSWHLPPGGILPKSKSDSLNKRKWDVTFVAGKRACLKSHNCLTAALCNACQ